VFAIQSCAARGVQQFSICTDGNVAAHLAGSKSDTVIMGLHCTHAASSSSPHEYVREVSQVYTDGTPVHSRVSLAHNRQHTITSVMKSGTLCLSTG
jgi:hypothetical protein